jgi:3-hydroxy-9,10-secoandrosta-1,3,5(10)-triene-9,17-dione monooxygenase
MSVALSDRTEVTETVVQFFGEERRDKLIADAKALRPLLERSAPSHEANGELLPEVIEALDAMGAFKMGAPCRLGGAGVSLTVMSDVVIEIAKGCPSSAWVVSIINSCVWVASQTPLPMQEALFADGVPKISQPQTVPGTAVVDGNSLIINGRWSYGSGSHHSDWVLCRVATPDKVSFIAAVPLGDLLIENSWKVAGMKGTGSDTLVAKDVRVPIERTCRFDEMAKIKDGSEGYLLEPTDRFGYIPFLRSKALGVLVGIAEGLLEVTLKVADKPLLTTSYTKKSDSGVFQAKIGEAAAKINAAKLVMYEGSRSNDLAALEGRPLDYGERSINRGNVGIAIDLLASAVDMLMTVSGSSAFSDSNPAQRYWRDFGISSRHIAFSVDASYEIYGRYILGVEPNISPLDYI